jgi:predicted metal-dependent hydrolase
MRLDAQAIFGLKKNPSMHEHADLKYLDHYPDELKEKVRTLINNDGLAQLLLKKYPTLHEVRGDRALYEYVMGVKNEHLRKSGPIARIGWDDRMSALNNYLGVHKFVSRVHGNRLRASNEILIASVFKKAPLAFLRMIAVHELAHLKEKDHNRAFYNLCMHIEPDYHQIEFDMRLFLTCIDLYGSPYTETSRGR